MSKDQPLTGGIPTSCPQCQARLPLSGKTWDQKKATLLRVIAGAVLCGCTLLGIYLLMLYAPRISVKMVLIVVGVSSIPAGIVFSLAAEDSAQSFGVTCQ